MSRCVEEFDVTPWVKDPTHVAPDAPDASLVALVGAPALGDIPQYDGTKFVSKRGEFGIAAFFTAGGQTLDLPVFDFPFRIIGWRARVKPAGSAAFTVQRAASVTDPYADMIGAGTAPAVSAALGALDDTLDWDAVDVAANEVVELGCATLTTATQAALTLRCRRA